MKLRMNDLYTSNIPCVFQNNALSAIYVEDNLLLDNLREEILKNIGKTDKKIRYARFSYDIFESETVQKNMKIQHNQHLEQFFIDCSIDIHKTIEQLTHYERAVIRLKLLSEDIDIIFFDNLFESALSLYDKQQLIALIARIQDEQDCLIIPLLDDVADGIFFGKLTVLHPKTKAFLPLK